MSGVLLDAFADFMFATGRTVIRDGADIVLEAKKHSYHIARLIEGELASKKLLEGGTSVSKNAVFRDLGNFKPYNPGVGRNYSNPQRLHKVETFFRYYESYVTWVDNEVLQNPDISAAARYGNTDALYTAFASVRDEKKMLADATMWNGMEAAMWAKPSYAQMEVQSGTNSEDAQLIMSIVAFINEFTDGLWGTGLTSESAFTTKQGKNPADSELDGRYKPQQQGYANLTYGDPNSLISALDNIGQDLKWQLPMSLKAWQENDVHKKKVWITTKKGITNLKNMQRDANDRSALGPQEAGWPEPLIYGIPVQRSEDFEKGAYYAPASGTSAVVDTSANNTGPRYLAWDGNTLYPYFHRDRYMEADKPRTDLHVPDQWVMRRVTWWNWICTSMQSQGCVYPTADVA